MKNIQFKAKRIDYDEYVVGNYFKSPLTEENSGIDSKYGWFFLSDGTVRHCIEQNNVCFVIDINTLEIIEQ